MGRRCRDLHDICLQKIIASGARAHNIKPVGAPCASIFASFLDTKRFAKGEIDRMNRETRKKCSMNCELKFLDFMLQKSILSKMNSCITDSIVSKILTD